MTARKAGWYLITHFDERHAEVNCVDVREAVDARVRQPLTARLISDDVRKACACDVIRARDHMEREETGPDEERFKMVANTAARSTA
jgi:hypothetical protein